MIIDLSKFCFNCGEFFLSTVARDEGAGYGPNDCQLFIAPTSGEGGPIVGLLTDRQASQKGVGGEVLAYVW